MATSSFNLLNLNGTNGFAINGIAAGDSAGWSVSEAGDVNGDGIDDIIIGAYEALSKSGQAYVVFGTRSGFSASFNLSGLNGTNGFKINGTASGDYAGFSVSTAGDFNGDGIDDIIIGAKGANPNAPDSGQSYVIFGRTTGFNGSLDLSSLSGTNGFALNGIANGDLSGYNVGDAGDVNADGIGDIIIGAWSANPNSRNDSGQTYVVFGSRSSFGPSFNLSTLNGSNGFTLNGIESGDRFGYAVSRAGDINADGIGDIIIGARNADPNSNSGSGQSYVLFGRNSGFSSTPNLADLNGTNGFAINGIGSFDYSGYSVSSAGDVNGDGIDDLVVSATGFNGIGSDSGQGYVVFGRNTAFSGTLNLVDLNGTNGFKIDSISAGDNLGISIAGAGDVNGDGIDDIVVGADEATPNGYLSGQSYVIFGSRNFRSSVNLATLDGDNGFKVDGLLERDRLGLNVSTAGDVNGDGVDDIIIGAPADSSFGSAARAGQSYVIFGVSNAPTITNIDDGDGDNIVNVGDPLTYTITFNKDIDSATVSAADFNNAGSATIAIGAIAETSPGVFTVQVTPSTTGNIQLRIPTGAVISDVAGNNLAVPVQDGDTITVNDVSAPPDTTPPTVTTIDDGDADNIVNVGDLLNYTVNFSEDIDAATVSAADFDSNAGTATIAIGAVSETTPGLFTVQVTPLSAGTVILRIPTGSVISDVAGNNLSVPVADTDVVTVNSAPVPVTPGVTVSQSDGSTNVTEGAATDSYTLVLNSQPTSDVTVTLTPDSQVLTSASTLTFTPVNWNTAQTVTVTAVDDTLVEGSHTGAIAHTISTTDTNYSALTIPNITANITDNDSTSTPPTNPPANPPANPLGQVTTPNFTLREPGSKKPSGISPTNAADGDFYNFSDNNNGTVTSPILLSNLNIGDRIVRTLSGDDVVSGTEFRDRIQANAGADLITGLGGDDLIRGGQGMDSIYGNDGGDILWGNKQSDLLVSEQGADLLYGGGGKDSLEGGSGNDTLSGDRGQDFLRGGEGADVFVLRGGDFLASRPEDADIILDFNISEDKIGLEDEIAFGQLSFETVNLSIDSGAPFTATAIKNSSGNYLGILVGVQPASLTAGLFTPINID